MAKHGAEISALRLFFRVPDAAPILQYSIGAAIHTPLIGEAQQIKKSPRKFLNGAAKVPHYAYWPGERPALPISARGNTEPIKLAVAST